MQVIAHDPFVTPEKFRELQVGHCSRDEVFERSDFISLHAPLTVETRHLVRAETIERMRPGVRIVNAARGDLIDIDALVAALKDGRVAGAALDVFPSEPYTDGEVLTLPNVVVTPHLGASTQEAQDRAGLIVAEQVVAALAGEFVSNAVNIPLARAEDMEVMGPFLPLASKLGRLAAGLSGGGFDRIEVTCSGRAGRVRHAAADLGRAGRGVRRPRRRPHQPGQRPRDRRRHGHPRAGVGRADRR